MHERTDISSAGTLHSYAGSWRLIVQEFHLKKEDLPFAELDGLPFPSEYIGSFSFPSNGRKRRLYLPLLSQKRGKQLLHLFFTRVRSQDLFSDLAGDVVGIGNLS